MEDLPPIDIPNRMPLIVLPSTLFPHCLMPLFIFEPRYREMLKTALEGDRFMAIGTCDPDADFEDDDREVSSISTAGIIRACVTHDDGTSHLLLLGAQRIRFTGWIQEQPFRIAEVEPIPGEMEDAELAERLASDTILMAEELSESAEGMSDQVRAHLRTLEDPSDVADVVAHSFVTNQRHRQALLETNEVTDRLHLLQQLLQARIAGES